MGIKGLTAAIQTLTSIPMPGKGDKDLSLALPWFPVVGLLLGIVLWIAGFLWALLPFSGWSFGCAMLLVILDVLLTRGLHLDGLADWADSMGGFGRDRRLAIMKDTSVGVFGTIAVLLCLISKLVIFERLFSSETFLWIVPVMVLSRAMMTELIATLPYARSSDGMARPFVENAGKGKRISSLIIAGSLCLISGPAGLALLIIAWSVTMIYRVYCLKKFGGITGDLLGAADEINEVILMALCALPGQYMSVLMGWGWLS
ncbi:MAG: adenosylcobinamide-GDP ribazoletransferase [Deltaproteobacteria bacterium]|nr:adenosylcobinamide-GDP ribazoletransferase [Deltaproteobacteria bacterium]